MQRVKQPEIVYIINTIRFLLCNIQLTQFHTKKEEKRKKNPFYILNPGGQKKKPVHQVISLFLLSSSSFWVPFSFSSLKRNSNKSENVTRKQVPPRDDKNVEKNNYACFRNGRSESESPYFFFDRRYPGQRGVKQATTIQVYTREKNGEPSPPVLANHQTT